MCRNTHICAFRALQCDHLPNTSIAGLVSTNCAGFSSGYMVKNQLLSCGSCLFACVFFRYRGLSSLDFCASASKCSKLFLLSEPSLHCFVVHQLAQLYMEVSCYFMFVLSCTWISPRLNAKEHDVVMLLPSVLLPAVSCI